MMRATLLPFLLLSLLAAPARAEEPPAPDVNRVDHARPEAHLDLPASVVEDAARLRSIAGQLRGERPQDTLVALARWIDRNLRADAGQALVWRTADRILEDRSYGSCADHALLFGLLARAAGIPTIWVKTMDLDWIRDFRAGRPEASNYRGHVFLEVHVDGRWQLLDAQSMRLYDPYDPAARWLPGQRFAYDKGDDPHALVLSCRWDLWKAQTDAYFSALDDAVIPWSRSQDLLGPWRVWIAGDRPRYAWADRAARAAGYSVEATFNTAFDRHLAAARGHVLVVTVTDGQPVLPEAERDAWLPPGWREAVAGTARPEGGWLAHRREDGTRVILVLAEDQGGLTVAVSRALRE